jgi:hypothetical protein
VGTGSTDAGTGDSSGFDATGSDGIAGAAFSDGAAVGESTGRAAWPFPFLQRRPFVVERPQSAHLQRDRFRS